MAELKTVSPHTPTKHKPGECAREGNCMICDGGLFLCAICGLLEGALTTDCPGEYASDKSDVVYAGKLDFRNGQWVEAKNPTNQMWESFKKELI